MSFMKNISSPYESVNMIYFHNDRFIRCVFANHTVPFRMKYEIDILMEKEMEYWRKDIIKKPPIRLYTNREINDYNIEYKSTFFLCMRITNINKAIYLLKKLSPLKCHKLTKKLEHIEHVLQEEYKELYHSYYNVSIHDKSPFRKICSMDVPFVEYLINNDMYAFFKSGNIQNPNIYLEHRISFMQYMCVIYLQIELELLLYNLKDEVEDKKDTSDFISYYNCKRACSQFQEIICNEINHFKSQINVESIYDKVLRHQIITFSET